MDNSYDEKKIKKVSIVSIGKTPRFNRMLLKEGFKIVQNDPDFIVCYGGDGTLLYGERKFPGVPKLIIKKQNICRKCDYVLHQTREILSNIRNGKFSIRNEMKLEGRVLTKKLIGLNEVQIHTKLPIYAIRFSLSVNEMEFDNLIGDGAIIATPFGSTGYYKSTGGKQFRKGIGISFNNIHNKRVRSFVVPESSKIKITVNRGPALLLVDNNEKSYELGEKDISVIRKSETEARFIYAL